MDRITEVSDVDLDITREIINIGLAKVADSLAMIAKETVHVNVPDVKLINPNDLDRAFPPSNPQDVVIQSDIDGDFLGQTFLIFTKEQVENIALVCLGPREGFEGNYTALEKSLLLEISNMLTGTLITQLANILNFKLFGMPPQFVPYRERHTFLELIKNLHLCKPFILTVKTEFKNSGSMAEMPLLVVFDCDTFDKVINTIRKQQNSGKVIVR